LLAFAEMVSPQFSAGDMGVPDNFHPALPRAFENWPEENQIVRQPVQIMLQTARPQNQIGNRTWRDAVLEKYNV